MSRPSPYYLRYEKGIANVTPGKYHLFFSLYPELPQAMDVVHTVAMCTKSGRFSGVVKEADVQIPICTHCLAQYARYCLEGPSSELT